MNAARLLLAAVFATGAFASRAESHAHEKSPVQLSRAPATLHDLVARHRTGEDVRASLVTTLASMLPRGYFSLPEVKAGQRAMRTSVSNKGSEWLHLHVADPATFRRHLFGGGHYDRDVAFNLLAGAPSAPHSVISKIRYAGGRLLVRLERDKDGRAFDRRSRYQELVIRFDGEGRASGMTIQNFSRTWLPWGTAIDVSLPATVRAQDPVWLPSPVPQAGEGTTLYRQ